MIYSSFNYEVTKLNRLISKIDPLHINDIKNRDHSSYFFTTQSYTLLITRFFDLEKEGLIGLSIPYVLFDDAMYIYTRESERFELLERGHTAIADSIKEQLLRSEKLIMHYVDAIEKLEDDLYMRKLSPIFLDVWFDLKKDITRMERMFERSFEALKKYLRFYEKESDFCLHEFTNILEHIERFERLSSLNSNKLDTLYNYYNSLKNDKMNNNVYALTILSGIFLPLNLVVGFFGMNTEGLFFAGNPLGTQNVVVLLGGLFVLFLLAIPIIRVIERVLLRRLLGRFNLYNQLIQKVKNIALFTKE